MHRVNKLCSRASVRSAWCRWSGGAGQFGMTSCRLLVIPEKHQSNATVFSEAACGPVAALVLVAGVGATVTHFLLGKKSKDQKTGAAVLELPHELIDAKDFSYLHKRGSSASFEYVGSDSKSSGISLCIRLDDDKALISDKAASLLLAQNFARKGDIVRLSVDTVSELLNGHCDFASASAGERHVNSGWMGLKIANDLPPGAHEGAIVTIELQPGSGLLDLYGTASAFRMEADSGLQRGKLANKGKYSARDLFSGRPDRVRRALHALAEFQEDNLRIVVDGKCIFPPESSDPASMSSIAGSIRESTGVDGGLGTLLEIFAECIEREGKNLLTALLRAQCSAGPKTTEQAHQLYQVMCQQAGPFEDGFFKSPEALQIAFARGFWTLPSDETGKSTREREGERLLERARRELWAEGSSSRRELEEQSRIFLSRNLIGQAANVASIRLRIVRARTDSPHNLRDLHFTPATTASGSGLWYRLDLLDFELPSERALQA